MKEEDKLGLKKASDELKRLKGKFGLSNKATTSATLRHAYEEIFSGPAKWERNNNREAYGRRKDKFSRVVGACMKIAFYQGRLSAQREYQEQGESRK